ncbi:helix-turn-helix transcriptional regulator [Streptomyces bungoensis]|uniref:helix-turn-helix transcriptional regulator n=1 Tax=Streptomyces bungoensis TaxID=285568 RepID=UPI0036777339
MTGKRKDEVDMSKIHALLEVQPPQVAQLPEPPERERLRKAQGLTQAQVAEALGVTRGAVSAWEAGRYDPRGTVRIQYAELLRLIAERHPAPDGGGGS